MDLKIYVYSKCSTCQEALRFLKKNKIPFEELPIVEQPPTEAELKTMLGHLKKDGGDLKNLFNTSGVVYRELKVSEKLKAGLTEAEALKLLAKNGKLIKRPFILAGKTGTVGFKEAAWKKIFQ